MEKTDRSQKRNISDPKCTTQEVVKSQYCPSQRCVELKKT